jgi:hypothetical protein
VERAPAAFAALPGGVRRIARRRSPHCPAAFAALPGGVRRIEGRI